MENLRFYRIPDEICLRATNWCMRRKYWSIMQKIVVAGQIPHWPLTNAFTKSWHVPCFDQPCPVQVKVDGTGGGGQFYPLVCLCNLHTCRTFSIVNHWTLRGQFERLWKFLKLVLVINFGRFVICSFVGKIIERHEKINGRFFRLVVSKCSVIYHWHNQIEKVLV